jgi:O-antigen/teichoic acid export membrane protein
MKTKPSSLPTDLRVGSGKTNVVWSALDYAAIPLGMLIATPMLIRYLGLEQFGVLVLINTFIGFSSVFNFGFGDTALKYVSHYKHRNQLETAREIVRTISVLSIAAGACICGLTLIIAPAAARIFNIASLPYAIPALYVTTIIMPLRLLESVYVATLRGCYRYDLAGYATTTTKLANIITLIILAAQGQELAVLLCGTACAALVSTLLLFVFCYRNLGNTFPTFSVRAFKEIRRFSLWSWVQGLSGLVYVNIDRLMISAMLGPTALGIYGVCIQLTQNMHNGLAAVSHTLFPKISMLNSQHHSKQNMDEAPLRDYYIKATRAISVPAILASSVIAVFSFQILDLWVGSSIAKQGHLLLSLLAISFGWFTANSVITYYTLNGLGRVRLQAVVSGTGAMIMAISCIVFIPMFSLIGAATARFPDVLWRIGVRFYVGETIIGHVRKIVALGFVWITIIAVCGTYIMKKLLVWLVGREALLKEPVSVVTFLLFVVVMYFMLNWVEQNIEKKFARVV